MACAPHHLVVRWFQRGLPSGPRMIDGRHDRISNGLSGNSQEKQHPSCRSWPFFRLRGVIKIRIVPRKQTTGRHDTLLDAQYRPRRFSS